MPARGTPSLCQYFLHLPPADAVMGQGDLHVKDNVGGFTGDFFSVVVFAGHHEFSTLFANLLQDAVVPPASSLLV